MIQTQFGGVGLRRPRAKKTIKLHMPDGRPGEAATIQKNWLKDTSRRGKTEEYRVHVKQSMLIAATQIEMEDLTIVKVDPSTGQLRTPELVRTKMAEFTQKIKGMENGTMPVARRSVLVSDTLVRQTKRLEKHMLTKRSAKCGSSRTRWFTIDSGRLHVFKSDGHHAKVRKSFDLSEARCQFEYTKMPSLHGEAFAHGKEFRVCVQCRERPQGPLYLYPDEVDASKASRQAKNWERAIRMSRYLQSPQDRDALSTVVQYVTGNVMTKGWFALFTYSGEILNTKKTIKTVAMRLMKVELSRGWHKARLVYLKRTQAAKQKKEQQDYAAKFLAERMGRINNQAARSPQLVRAAMISQMQSKFRKYRQEKIFDRAYPLGSTVNSRTRQGHSGMSLDCSFASLKRGEAMQLVLDSDGLRTLQSSPDIFQSKISTFSEVTMPLHRSHVSISDSLTMLSFTERDDSAEHGHLAEANWAHFVNLDQISSVVLHSERMMKTATGEKTELHPDMVNGVWFTIHGPRVCWGRRIHSFEDPTTKEEKQEVVGAPDGLEVARALASGDKVRWLKMSVGFRSASIPKVDELKLDETASNPGDNESEGSFRPKPEKHHFQTYMVVHVLGRKFMSDVATGESPQYPMRTFEAEVPIPSGETALAGLDMCPVTVDIVEWAEIPEYCRTVWAGKVPLWKIFAADTSPVNVNDTLRNLRSLGKKPHIDADEDHLVSLTETMPGGGGQALKRIALFHPYDELGKQKAKAYVELEFSSRVQDHSDSNFQRCISPELQGCGLVTSLYSTHRGAWYDPRLGPQKFTADHVPNFVELSFDTLAFLGKDTVDSNKPFRYHIEARCYGTAVCSRPLHRPKPAWNHVIPTDAMKINWQHARILVPVPPGAWVKERGTPMVELAVFRCPVHEVPTLSFRELLSFGGKTRHTLPHFERVYHTRISLEGLLLDQPRSGVTVIMSRALEPPTECKPANNVWGNAYNGAELHLDIVLRDRDYVRMSMSDLKRGEHNVALAVGDSAMLVVEEPLMYPRDEQEFRRRFLPGTFDPSAAKRAGKFVADLRDPSLSHEYAISGLDRLDPPVPFKQKFMPTVCDDIIPYKFVLPMTETDFMRQAWPGQFWRIMEDLIEEKGRAVKEETPRKHPATVVSRLSHVTKKVPISILAVYANATCDVEVAPAFILQWEEHPERQYGIPGTVVVREFKDTSQAHVINAPQGTGDVGERWRRRIVLKEVPISSLLPVHSASFNIYDARFATTEEAAALPPSVVRNDFNPRLSAEALTLQATAGQRRGGYAIGAGPLPCDAGPGCQYEWSAHLRAPSEDDMYHFVATLLQCTRMGQYEQMQKMREFKSKSTKTNKEVMYHLGPPLTTQSGYLEVVLVEARRLKPTRVQKYKDAMDRVTKMIAAELNPFVVFRLNDEGEPSEYRAGRVIQPGETIRIRAEGYEGTTSNGESFSIDLKDKLGGIALHWGARFDRKVVLRNAHVNGSWGEEENEGLWPHTDPSDKNFQIDFTRGQEGWYIYINGERREEFDFRHRSVSEVHNVIVSDTLVEPSICVVPRHDLVFRGSKTQTSPMLSSTSSPNWARSVEECQNSGGWVFKTSPLDPPRMPKLWFELSVMHKGLGGMNYQLGVVRVPVTGGQGEGGAPSLNLCDPTKPFHNMWVPLSSLAKDGSLVPNVSGEVHIMTRWVANQQTQAMRRLPNSARAFFLQDLRNKLQAAILREPVYELQVNRSGYNPNVTKDGHPLRWAEVNGLHAEEIYNTMPYLESCAGRQLDMWSRYLGDDLNQKLGEIRAQWVQEHSTEKTHELDELLRRGVPPMWRISNDVQIWLQITNATSAQESFQEGIKQSSEQSYLALLEVSKQFKSDAMLQLQEDLVTAAGWETSPSPAHIDIHLQRLKRARNVCAALITFSYVHAAGQQQAIDMEVSTGGSEVGAEARRQRVKVINVKDDPALQTDPTGVSYCESLLVIAFFLLLPQVENTKEAHSKSQAQMQRAKGKDSNKAVQKDAEETAEECRVFWLLYTLIASPLNGVFNDYYGTPMDPKLGFVLCNHKGAQEDVLHLATCLHRYDRELSTHLNSLGFHLSTVFHGAFMRLFAFYLPTASVFRFWDLIFSQSTRIPKGVNKGPRHSLIDLAYATLMRCRPTLLLCDSALEVRDCLIDYMESLYDPSAVIEMATETESQLWEHFTHEAMKVVPLHIQDFTVAMEQYDRFFMQFRSQNEVLRDITREITLNLDGRTKQQTSGVGTSTTDRRLTTKNVVNYVMHPLQNILMADTKEERKFGGMFRKTPVKICEQGPRIDASIIGTVWWYLGRAAETIVHEDLSRPQAYSMPVLLGTQGEPTNLNKNEWMRQVGRALGPEWNKMDCVGRVYDSFESLTERRMSLNEFFTALICCSKGTVGEKALALFHLYSHYELPHRLNHLTPVLSFAKAVVEKVEGNQERDKGLQYMPPDDEDIPKETALHFKVYTHTQGHDILLGEAFVQSLHPFVWAGMGKDSPLPFTIWGTKMRLPPGAQVQARASDPAKIRPYIGEMHVAVKWMPCGDSSRPEVGQLGIHVFSIRLDPNRVEAPHWKNPWIEVVTYDDQMHPKQIPRWDPRSQLRKAANTASVGLAYAGAFKDHIEWAETMRRDALGHLHHRWNSGEHGWDKVKRIWVWSKKWGDQYSTHDFTFRKDFCQITQRPNAISIQACRHLTLSILRRSLHFVTNRQAVLIADQIFNRAGAVPGIIDAIIVQGERISNDYKTIRELKEAYDKSGKSYKDVKHQLNIELEKQVNRNMGNVNLFPPTEGGDSISLKAINIDDPFPSSQKVLWIRFTRAGDGERGQARISIGGDGNFRPQLVPLDMELGSRRANAQMAVTKEEFVSCMLNSQLLSESLRQLSSSDHTTANLPALTPIKLDVAVSDPSQRFEDDDIFDMMNVRQSVLLEVWDYDRASLDDFLGECWLPPLGTLGTRPRQFVLQVRDAASDDRSTRPDAKKKLPADATCKGDLYVVASWALPAEVPPEGPDEESLEARVKHEEMLHTGKLFLKIVRAEGLRAADVRRKHGSDPYVIAYVRNDCYQGTVGEDGWRKHQVTGYPDPIFKTGWKRATLNPEWNEEATITMKTGAFEKRTKQRLSLHMTKRGKQAAQDTRDLAVIKDQEELRIYFGDEERMKNKEPGARHDVQVYLGESLREFKQKLLLACQREAAISAKAREEVLAGKFRTVAMSYKHCVTVFVPSERLRSLAQEQRTNAHEYKRLYRLEETDPSSWQPLDQIRTFQHYQSTYGFGLSQSQRLRVCEGTEDYKLRNHRYRQFSEDVRQMNIRQEEMNTEQLCFGYGLYTHAYDGGSTEWRPVMVDRPDADGSADTTRRNFIATWIYAQKLTEGQAGAAANLDEAKEEIDEDSILLAPLNPKILGSGHLEHQEFLAQAKDFHSQGMNEQEITKRLNDKLMASYRLAQEAERGDGKALASAPPPITAQEVRHHLHLSSDETISVVSGALSLASPGGLQRQVSGVSGMTSATAMTSGVGPQAATAMTSGVGPQAGRAASGSGMYSSGEGSSPQSGGPGGGSGMGPGGGPGMESGMGPRGGPGMGPGMGSGMGPRGGSGMGPMTGPGGPPSAMTGPGGPPSASSMAAAPRGPESNAPSMPASGTMLSGQGGPASSSGFMRGSPMQAGASDGMRGPSGPMIAPSGR